MVESSVGEPQCLQADEFSVSTAVSSCPTRLKGCPRWFESGFRGRGACLAQEVGVQAITACRFYDVRGDGLARGTRGH